MITHECRFPGIVGLVIIADSLWSLSAADGGTLNTIDSLYSLTARAYRQHDSNLQSPRSSVMEGELAAMRENNRICNG
jgi:hypothetical protein